MGAHGSDSGQGLCPWGWKAFGSSDGFAPLGPELVVERATIEASRAPADKLTVVL